MDGRTGEWVDTSVDEWKSGDYFTRVKDSFARERPYSDTQIDEKQQILLLTDPKERRLPGRAT